MQKSNIDLYYSIEVINEITKNMNSILRKIQIIKEKILKLSELDAWDSINCEYFKNKCNYTLNQFISECNKTNDIIRTLIKNLENYEVIDKKIIQSIYGNMNA